MVIIFFGLENIGIGVGLTRDTATLMVGQYFKRRREAVEIALVGSSGIGLAVMTVFLHTTLRYLATLILLYYFKTCIA